MSLPSSTVVKAAVFPASLAEESAVVSPEIVVSDAVVLEQAAIPNKNTVERMPAAILFNVFIVSLLF